MEKQITINESEYLALKKKADKWENLRDKILGMSGHEDKDGQWIENESNDLGTIGEACMLAFGLM